MSRYRKKPVEIEAWRNTGDATELARWLTSAKPTLRLESRMVRMIAGGAVEIETLEGTMRAEVGDWLICGVEGELYPCKPSVFDATYERVEQ